MVSSIGKKFARAAHSNVALREFQKNTVVTIPTQHFSKKVDVEARGGGVCFEWYVKKVCPLQFLEVDKII